MYLSGEFGNEPNAVNAYAASSFYAVDRYASFKKDWEQFYNEGGVIIADRYTTSNAIHQCSKLSEGQWDSYLEWLFCYEYILLGIPKPDIVIYLNVDTQVSQKLIAGRYQGDESKRIFMKEILNIWKVQEQQLFIAVKNGMERNQLLY